MTDENRKLKKENIKLRSLCRKAAEQVIDDHKETLQKLADNPYPYKHLKEDCVAYQEGGMGCPDCYCDSSCKDDACHICGGNTPERVEEQIERLEKVITWREEDILDDEDKRLYDRLIKEIITECHSETLDWDEDRMRARLRKVIETT